jgi:hypothetical protein
MTVTEQQVNELAQKTLAGQSNVPVSDVQVRLEPGQIVGSGKVRFGFLTFDIEITAIISVKDGRPVPEITGIKVGGQPLGEPFRSQVLNMITPYLDRMAQADLAVIVEGVEITSDQIRIVGRYK